MWTVIGILTGLFGVGGAIGLAMAWPMIGPFVGPAISAAGELVRLVLRYRVTVGILCFAIGALYGDIHGQRLELAKWRKADLVAQAEKDRREATIANETAQDYAARAVELQSEYDILQKKVKDHESQVTGNVCRVGPDADRLRDIIR